jgi:integrase
MFSCCLARVFFRSGTRTTKFGVSFNCLLTKLKTGKSSKNSSPADIHEKPKNYLSEDEIGRLLATSKESRNPERNYLLLLMMFRHGLRVSEAMTLTWHSPASGFGD